MGHNQQSIASKDSKLDKILTTWSMRELCVGEWLTKSLPIKMHMYRGYHLAKHDLSCDTKIAKLDVEGFFVSYLLGGG